MGLDQSGTQPALRRLIGTFHKSGTVLFGSILRAGRTAGVLNPWFMHQKREPRSWDVAFDHHTTKLLPILASAGKDARCVICIRDPRDIVVSGAYYHLKSTEAWLHVRKPSFGGMTYQQKINALPDMQARFRFEMQHAARETIEAMRKIPPSSDTVLITRLEMLVTDTELVEYERIFAFLEFAPDVQATLKRIAREKSIFSATKAPSGHVRSGKPAQYLTEFSPETAELFREQYGDVVEKLGYPGNQES